MIKVNLNESMTIEDVYNLFDQKGILGNSFNEVNYSQIEVINLENIGILSLDAQDSIEQYGDENETVFNGDLERKWFFQLTDEREGEFSFGGFLSFYTDDSIINEFDGNNDDFEKWKSDILEICEKLEWIAE